jgi:DNA repair exonuclease SbcCD ATPase subunit
MRIKSISLSWFRGASELVELNLNAQSIVIYGENGSGKSSFVDAVEYAVRRRVEHLAHEYSGKRQEKALVNTHTPDDKTTQIEIEFASKDTLAVKIDRDGKDSSSGPVEISNWDYHRTILRQNEVSDFISSTKGGKYSELLPLFGLDPLEHAAENLRQLCKQIEQEAGLATKRREVAAAQTTRKVRLAEAKDEAIEQLVDELQKRYLPSEANPANALQKCDDISAALSERINAHSETFSTYSTLLGIAQLDVTGDVDDVRTANSKFAAQAEPHILERLAILESASAYARELEGGASIVCPACGSSISSSDFTGHVSSEKTRLEGIITSFEDRKRAIGKLCDVLVTLKGAIAKNEIAAWREARKDTRARDFSYIDVLDVARLRASCTEEDLRAILEHISTILEDARESSSAAPPDIAGLIADRDTLNAARQIFASKALLDEVDEVERLIAFVSTLESEFREQIRAGSQNVINEITSEIQAMWSKLHPDEKIEDIHLYCPPDTDKAIEIGLKFYGKEQDSPRLTLSEGHRNSLGLCIFLAMAKREATTDRPLFLDDVVVSIDRNHRGMILQLLEEYFSDRQVVLLTHDREWFIELRRQITSGGWDFKALMPWNDPTVGIRWSARVPTFDDARSFLKENPDVAGNKARSYMDIELAFVAQDLRTKLPYLHREKNDLRGAHEFLERIVADAAKCFEIRVRDGFIIFEEGVKKLAEADRLIISWGNRASHGELARVEAVKLIDACEAALHSLICTDCKKLVTRKEDEKSRTKQCECGKLRWSYGKA